MKIDFEVNLQKKNINYRAYMVQFNVNLYEKIYEATTVLFTSEIKIYSFHKKLN